MDINHKESSLNGDKNFHNNPRPNPNPIRNISRANSVDGRPQGQRFGNWRDSRAPQTENWQQNNYNTGEQDSRAPRVEECVERRERENSSVQPPQIRALGRANFVEEVIGMLTKVMRNTRAKIRGSRVHAFTRMYSTKRLMFCWIRAARSRACQRSSMIR